MLHHQPFISVYALPPLCQDSGKKNEKREKSRLFFIHINIETELLWDSALSTERSKIMRAKPFFVANMVILFICGTGFAQTETAEFFYNRGRERFANSDYYHAMEDYNSALQLKPDYVDALCGRAEIYMVNNYFEEAERDFSTIIAAHPKYERAYVGRGQLYNKAGYYTRAIADWTRALELNPGLVELEEKLADLYLYLGTNKSAMEDIYRMMKDLYRVCLLSPDNVTAWYRLGVLFLYVGSFAEAEACFMEVQLILEKTRNQENFIDLTGKNQVFFRTDIVYGG